MKPSRDAIWPVLIMATLLLTSGQSRVAAPGWDLPIDKIGHFVVFGMLAASWLRMSWFEQRGWKGACFAALLATIYGALDEYRQSFTNGRSVEFMDWVADTAGAVSAVLVIQGIPWVKRTLQASPKDIRLKSPVSSDITPPNPT